MHTRAEILAQAFLGMKCRLPTCSFFKFCVGLTDWVVKPVVTKDNELCGGVFIKMNEIHISVNSSYKGSWGLRSVLRLHLNPTMKTWGYVITKTHSDSGCNEFIQRIGFTPKYVDESGYVHYELRRVKYV